MGVPIPRWLGDPDYFPRTDPRREAHRAHIETRQRIDERIRACSADESYAVVVTRSEVR